MVQKNIILTRPTSLNPFRDFVVDKHLQIPVDNFPESSLCKPLSSLFFREDDLVICKQWLLDRRTSKKKVLIIRGATGSGKSTIAISLAYAEGYSPVIYCATNPLAVANVGLVKSYLISKNVSLTSSGRRGCVIIDEYPAACSKQALNRILDFVKGRADTNPLIVLVNSKTSTKNIPKRTMHLTHTIVPFNNEQKKKIISFWFPELSFSQNALANLLNVTQDNLLYLKQLTTKLAVSNTSVKKKITIREIKKLLATSTADSFKTPEEKLHNVHSFSIKLGDSPEHAQCLLAYSNLDYLAKEHPDPLDQINYFEKISNIFSEMDVMRSLAFSRQSWSILETADVYTFGSIAALLPKNQKHHPIPFRTTNRHLNFKTKGNSCLSVKDTCVALHSIRDMETEFCFSQIFLPRVKQAKSVSDLSSFLPSGFPTSSLINFARRYEEPLPCKAKKLLATWQEEN